MVIVSREAWGALAQARIERRVWPANPPLVVHHTVSPPPPVDASQAQEAAVMRGFDSHHFHGNGWAGGIGYSFVIFPSGRVYEGRGKDTSGAHSPGANHLPGVALVGDYRSAQPSPQALAALGALAGYLGASQLKGHRDYYGTTCPGDALYRLLPSVRIGAAQPPPAKPEPPDGATLRLTVRRKDGDLTVAGWKEAEGPLRWIAKNGLQPEPPGKGQHWIAWRGGRWYGARNVYHVAKRLVADWLD